MRTGFAIVAIVLSLLDTAHGQMFYDLLPDVGGVRMQGGCRVVFPLDSTYVVMGHRYDTSYAGSPAKPWMGIFSYGNQSFEAFSLKDPSFDRPFNVSIFKHAELSDSIWIIYGGRSINSLNTPYIFKLNIRSGKIIESKVLESTIIPGQRIDSRGIYYDNNILSVVAANPGSSFTRLFISDLDTQFNLLREIQVETGNLWAYPKYLERNQDGTYTIIVDARQTEPDGSLNKIMAYLRVDGDGQVLDYKPLPVSIPMGNNLTLAQNTIRNKDDDWVILGFHSIDLPDSCFNCWANIPYMVSASPEFDTLRWITRFYDIPYQAGNHHHVYTVTEVEDGFIGSGSFSRGVKYHYTSGGLLFKAGLNGDSLWMKKFIPLHWDEERLFYGHLYDVKATPLGTIVAVGQVSDRELEIIRPWILHLDKDGCLVPGCNLVSHTEDEQSPEAASNQFRIYPNPASADLYLLSTSGSPEQVTMQLISNEGRILHTRLMTFEPEAQYILPVDELTPGMYHLTFIHHDSGRVESHKFVKQ